ncbi:hypothetical protein KCU61_g180, partial [Aureobasidium melanogenum]
MDTNPTLEQLWASLAHGQLSEYKQLWDTMLARCVTPCQVSWFKVSTDEHLMTKTFKNEFMLVATYLLEGSCHSSAHPGTMKNIFEGWLRRGVPDLSALGEADKYLTFLQTYIRVDSVNAHHIEGVTELAKAPELPFDQHDRELFAHEAETSIQYASGPTQPSSGLIPSHSPVQSILTAAEKWTRMARASADRPYLMHMHCPKTGARLSTLKFTSALALMTAYLESFSLHPALWWYFDEFMRHYLDSGDSLMMGTEKDLTLAHTSLTLEMCFFLRRLQLHILYPLLPFVSTIQKPS